MPDSPTGSRFQGFAFPIDHAALLTQIQVLCSVRDLHAVLTDFMSRRKAG
ncbi:hypothetical protein [Massilia endophytica]|nr:hypothetical protein [Massilia endophytica]UGQ48823.1 hypothetical protein LSQ66_10290 [Massilia endophytica]